MKAKRLIATVLSAVMMLMLLSMGVFATETTKQMTRATTNYYYTPAMTAGTWWSGLDSNHIRNMTCNKSSLTGSDITVDFDDPPVGLPDTFWRDKTRICTVEVKEDDYSVFNANESVCKRTGTFGRDSRGLYRVVQWGTRSDINTDVIEDNDTVELYIVVNIETKARDTGTAVPANLIPYRFETTY